MKFKIIALSTCLMSLPLTMAASAAELTGCAAKEANVETQISYAKARGNSHEVAGLEKALKEIKSTCNDSTLKAQREQKIAEKSAKVAERKQELAEAKASGRSDKIAKKQEKLNDAMEELNEAEKDLLR